MPPQQVAEDEARRPTFTGPNMTGTQSYLQNQSGAAVSTDGVRAPASALPPTNTAQGSMSVSVHDPARVPVRPLTELAEVSPGVTGAVDAAGNLTMSSPGMAPTVIGPNDPNRPALDAAFRRQPGAGHIRETSKPPQEPNPPYQAPTPAVGIPPGIARPVEPQLPTSAPPAHGGTGGSSRSSSLQFRDLARPDFAGLAQSQEDQAGRGFDAQQRGADLMNSELSRQNSEQAQQEAARAEQMQRAEQDISQRISDVENMRIDPNNWFHSRGVVGSIGAAIAVGLGAAAQSLQGGANNALGIIDAAINRDMQAQQENLRNAAARLGNRENALGRLRQQFGDERSAEEAYRMRSLRMAQQQVQAMMARANSPNAQERLQEMSVGLDARIAEHRQGIVDTQTASEYAASRRRGSGSGQRPNQPNARNLAYHDEYVRRLIAQGVSPERAAQAAQAVAPIPGGEYIRTGPATEPVEPPTPAEQQAQRNLQTARDTTAGAINNIDSILESGARGESMGGVGVVAGAYNSLPGPLRNAARLAQQYTDPSGSAGGALPNGSLPILTTDPRLQRLQADINMYLNESLGQISATDRQAAEAAGLSLRNDSESGFLTEADLMQRANNFRSLLLPRLSGGRPPSSGR